MLIPTWLLKFLPPRFKIPSTTEIAPNWLPWDERRPSLWKSLWIRNGSSGNNHLQCCRTWAAYSETRGAQHWENQDQKYQPCWKKLVFYTWRWRAVSQSPREAMFDYTLTSGSEIKTHLQDSVGLRGPLLLVPVSSLCLVLHPAQCPGSGKKLLCPVSWSSRVDFGLLFTLPASVEKLSKSLGRKSNPCVTGNVFEAPSKACLCFSLTQNLRQIREFCRFWLQISKRTFFFLTGAQVKLACFWCSAVSLLCADDYFVESGS